MRKRFLAFALAATLAAGCLGASVPGMAGQGTAAAGSIQQEAGTEREAEETGEIQEKPCIEAAGAETETAEMETAGTEAGKADAVRETEAEETGKGPGTATEETGEGTENGTEITEKETEEEPEGGTEAGKQPGTAGPEKGAEPERGFPPRQESDGTGMFSAALKAAPKAAGQEDDDRGYCSHLNSYCPAYCVEAKSGQVDPKKIFDWAYNAYIHVRPVSTATYGALSLKNGQWGSGSALTAAQTTGIGPFSGKLPAYKFFCSEAQYQNSPNKAYAVYRNAVGVLDRTTCTIKYYDLRLTLAGFQKAFKSTDGEQKRKEHGTEAYFLWDPIRPGIYTRQLNYADVRIEVLEPGTDTVTSTAIKGFTLVKDLDQFQGISWAGSGPYYETYYSGAGEIRVANVGTAAAPRYYAHSTASADLTGDTDTRTWLGLGFHNGMSVTFVQAQGKYSQDGHNALATDLGAQPEVPVLPPAVTLQKYVGLNADPNNGLGSTKEAFLPNYCGDTYYYRVVVGCNTGDFRSLEVSDTFPEWLGVTGIKVYKQSGSGWAEDSSGFPNAAAKADASYGRQKTVTLPAAASFVKGNTYCIEYRVKAAPIPEFQKLASGVPSTAAHYWCTNTAGVSYTYGYKGSVAAGSPVSSNTVYTYMPKPPAVSLKKYVGLSSDIGDGLGSSSGADLQKFAGNVYYYRLVASFSNAVYTSAAVSDVFPAWEAIHDIKVYKKSGDSWTPVTSGVTLPEKNTSDSSKTMEVSFTGSAAKGNTYCIEYKVIPLNSRNMRKASKKPAQSGQCYYWDNSATLSYKYPTAGDSVTGTPVTSNTVRVRLPVEPEVTLEKYIGTDADPNNGLGGNALNLPHYGGDTFYYRIVAKFDSSDYINAVVSDVFHEWLGIISTKVYKKSGDSWNRVASGVTVSGADATYGSEKAIEVSIPGSTAKGNTFCIEYEVKVAPEDVMDVYLDQMYKQYDGKRSWGNSAAISYSCLIAGFVKDGTPVNSNNVYAYVPGRADITLKKYASLDPDINNGLGDMGAVYLPNYCGDSYYYRIVASFDDSIYKDDVQIGDSFPSWLTRTGTKVYRKSGDRWAAVSDGIRIYSTGLVAIQDDLAAGETYCIEHAVKVKDISSFQSLPTKPDIEGSYYAWPNVAGMNVKYSLDGGTRFNYAAIESNEADVYMPMPPIVSIEKSVSEEKDPYQELQWYNPGNNSYPGIFLSNYGGDRYYYYVDVSFNDVNYTRAVVSDTFWEWLGVTDVTVYKQSGDSWDRITSGITVSPLDSSFGGKKTIDVSISPECARGNTFRIEYEVWAAPPSVLEGLAKKPTFFSYYYYWDNIADLEYAYAVPGYGTGSRTVTSRKAVVKMNPPELAVYKLDRKTGAPVGGAKLSILDANGKVVRQLTSSQYGSVRIYELPSGTYTLREDKAPKGYKLADPVTFTITPDKRVHEVTMYDELLETCTVTVKKLIKASDVVWAHGNPSFFFDLVGAEEDGTEHSYAGAVTFTEDTTADTKGMLEGTYVFRDVPVGEYKVSERDAAPYTSATSVTGCSDWGTSVSGSMEPGQDYQKASVIIDTTGEPDRNPVVTFANDKQAWDDYRHTDLKVNRIPVER